MAGRRYTDDTSVDRYEDRRDYRSRTDRRVVEDRYVDDEIEYRRRPAGRERDREVLVREEVRERPRSPPAFLREGYGSTTAGPMVLRAREREEFEFVARPRRRSPSPEPEPKVEKEEIIIRAREDSDARPPPRVRERDVEVDREEIIIRRDERDVERRPARTEVDREELIIRREEQHRDPRPPDDYLVTRPMSHERARSRVRRSSSASNEEIIIRQDERTGRGVTRDREEIIIRKSSRSRSPTSVASPLGSPEPRSIRAPTIHQEIITHHRHIDHGYELSVPSRPRPPSRVPSPPSPPLSSAPPRARSEERIHVSRTQTHHGRTENEDIFIDRKEGPAKPRPAPYYDMPPGRPEPPRGREVQEEADFYNARALDRSSMGEGYHGATRDWAIVDVPPGTNRVRMDGVGGASQEITWQRYNGVRRSRFMPDGVNDGYPSELGRPAPLPLAPANGEIARRFGREREATAGLWTEITKDLVVREAIVEMGYEFEETADFYYIIAYLRYEDVAHLVGLSDDIRKDRRQRAREMEWENRVLPPPVLPDIRPLPLEPPPPRPRQDWDREEERYIERDVVYRGGRPPPPIGWRRP